MGFDPKKLCANRKGWTDNETRDICQRSWNNKLKQGTNRRIKWAWPRLRNFIFPTFTICCSRGRAFAPFDSTFGWQRLVSTSCRLVLDGLLLFKTYDWECDHIYIIYYYYYYYYYIYIYISYIKPSESKAWCEHFSVVTPRMWWHWTVYWRVRPGPLPWAFCAVSALGLQNKGLHVGSASGGLRIWQ